MFLLIMEENPHKLEIHVSAAHENHTLPRQEAALTV